MRLRRLPLFPLFGLFLVVLTASGAVYLGRYQAHATERVSHTLAVEVTIGDVLETLRAAESAHRGYLLVATPPFVADMAKARAKLGATLGMLQRQTADNPRQQAAIMQLRPLIERKIAFDSEGMRLVSAGRRSEAVARLDLGEGRALMVAIAARLEAMRIEEQRLLVTRTRTADNNLTLLAIGQFLGIALLLIVALLTLRDAALRSRAMESARDEARAATDAVRSEMQAREAVEAQLRQVQKMESIGQLTGGIAHDFNNMLAIIIGSLDMAQRRIGGDPAKLVRSLESAREGAERAATLTARLLAFSRQQPLAPLPIDANRLVAGMSELLRRTLGDIIAVETVLAGGLWRTYADVSQLENALLNLAVNGRDAIVSTGAPDGKLTIETGNAYLDDSYARARVEVEPGQYVLISVSDTGVGMPPDVLERAFDPFFTTKAVGKGTGLGLSQVFGFVKQSGGHVAIYSEPGEGTTVKLYLPRYTGDVADAPSAAARGPLPEGRPEEIILVVEDEHRVRHFSVDALRELGYTAISAGGGHEALALLAEQPKISLLFTDVVMPEMNGRRLADEARALRPDLKILYTTGYTRNAVVHNGMLDPGVAFLPKPFTMSALAHKVREVLDGGGINRPA